MSSFQRKAFPLLVASSTAGWLALGCVGDAPTTPPGNDAGGNEAAAETSTNDSGDGGPSTFCSTAGANVVLCEDFDQGDLKARGWSDDPKLTPPGPSVVATPTKSGVGALLSTSATTPSSGAWSRFNRTVNVGAKTKKAILEADLLLDQAVFTGTGDLVPFSMALNTATTPLAVAIDIQQSSWACVGPGVPQTSGEAFTTKSWHHVSITVDFITASTMNVTCAVDAKTVVITNAGVDGSAASADRRVPIGHNTNGNIGQVTLYTDNVVLRAE